MNKPIASIDPAHRVGESMEQLAEQPEAPHVVGAAPQADSLNAALLDSRRRWRELVLLTADLAFETDRQGRFALLAPDTVLGWSAEQLLGRRADVLLADPSGTAGFNPFRPRRRRAGATGVAEARRRVGGLPVLRDSADPRPARPDAGGARRRARRDRTG